MSGYELDLLELGRRATVTLNPHQGARWGAPYVSSADMDQERRNGRYVYRMHVASFHPLLRRPGQAT